MGGELCDRSIVALTRPTPSVVGRERACLRKVVVLAPAGPPGLATLGTGAGGRARFPSRTHVRDSGCVVAMASPSATVPIVLWPQ